MPKHNRLGYHTFDFHGAQIGVAHPACHQANQDFVLGWVGQIQ
jgi:hypothetical protein